MKYYNVNNPKDIRALDMTTVPPHKRKLWAEYAEPPPPPQRSEEEKKQDRLRDINHARRDLCLPLITEAEYDIYVAR